MICTQCDEDLEVIELGFEYWEIDGFKVAASKPCCPTCGTDLLEHREVFQGTVFDFLMTLG